ncbi:MAG: YHS domain-containing protein [Rhodospirillales bacterium]|nr:YHS domain-containing protein [Rhodospirillales bacterium]
MTRKILLAVLVAFGFGVAAGGTAHANAGTAVNITPDGIAIGGWDTVAYFTENRAVAGSEEFSHEWDGATWLFSSAENRDLFAGDPETYAPQFGGWCAYALSKGPYAAEVDPENAWTVRDGMLYLNWNERVRNGWLRNNVDNDIKVGERNWGIVSEDILAGHASYSRKSDSPWN